MVLTATLLWPLVPKFANFPTPVQLPNAVMDAANTLAATLIPRPKEVKGARFA